MIIYEKMIGIILFIFPVAFVMLSDKIVTENKFLNSAYLMIAAIIVVMLMHEKPQTLQVLPEIIAFFKEEGYEFGVYNEASYFNINFQKDDRF